MAENEDKNILKSQEESLLEESLLEEETEAEEEIPSGSILQEDARKLNKALKEERLKRKKLLKELQEFKGIDLKEYKKIKEEQEKTEAQRLKDEEKFKALSEKQAKMIADKEKQLRETAAKLERTQKLNKVKDLFFAAGGLKEISKATGQSCFDLAMRTVESRFEEDIDGTIKVVDQDGLQMKNEKGADMTPQEFFELMAQEPIYSGLFESSVKPGTGVNMGRDRRNGSSKESWEEFSQRQGYKGKNGNKRIFTG